MKKLFFAMAVLCVTAISTTQAQEKFLRFGIKGGANLGKLDGTGYQNGFQLGYHLGGFAQLNFMKGWGVQGELIFSSQSAKTTSDFSEIYNSDNLKDDNGKRIRMNYLSVPILANIPLGSPRVKLQLGPQFSTLLNKNNVFKGVDNAFNGGDVAGVAGLWLQLPIVNISARYIIGFTDVKKLSDAANSSNWKNQTIQLGVGVTL